MFFPFTLSSQAAVSNSTASTETVRFVLTLLEVLEPVADSSFTFLKERVKSTGEKEEGEMTREVRGGKGMMRKKGYGWWRKGGGSSGERGEKGEVNK